MPTKFNEYLDRLYNNWIFTDIILPFSLTRVLLLLVGWFSQYFSPSQDYFSQEFVERGWQFSQNRLLDIWGRWDVGWYYSIIREGYTVRGDLATMQSNIAFYPLYPMIVKFFSAFHPDALMTNEGLLLIGVIVSNLFLIGGLYFTYKLAESLFESREIARLTIWYLLFFPTAFFFSSFYTEATFLFFSSATLYFTYSKNWMWAGLMGFLAALTRNVGVFLTIPMLYQYWQSKKSIEKMISPEVIWLSLPALGLFSFMFYLYTLTGDFLAAVHVQEAWNREFTLPWETLRDPNNYRLFLSPVEKLITVISGVFGIAFSFMTPYIGLGIYSIILLFSPLSTGSLNSITRYIVVIIPIFMLLAKITEGKRNLQLGLMIALMVIQIMFFIGWTQFYWVG